MEHYTITIIGTGKDGEAKTHALACLAALTKALHTVSHARIAIDKGGTHDLTPVETKKETPAK